MANQDLGINIKATLDGVEEAVNTIQELFKKGSEAAKSLSAVIGGDVTDSLKLMTTECEVMAPALEAAFNPLAIIAFAKGIADAADKLSQFIADTFIYTEAEKDADEELKRANQARVEHLQLMEKLNDTYQRMGKTASQQIEIDIAATEAQLALKKQQAETQWRMKTYDAETVTQEKLAAAAYEATKQVIQEVEAQLRNLNKQRQILSDEEMKPAVEAEIQGWEKVQQARIDVERSAANAIQSWVHTTAAEREATERQLENQLYQVKLTALSRSLELEKLDPYTNIAQITSLQHQIEELTLEHAAKLNEIHSRGIAEQRKQAADWEKSVIEANSQETAPNFSAHA